MADQRPWWKLWMTALSDGDLEALSLEDWARWARLGVYIKTHGEGGRVVIRYPGGALTDLFRYTSGGHAHGGPHGSHAAIWERLIATLHRLPGVTIEESRRPHGDPTDTLRDPSVTPPRLRGHDLRAASHHEPRDNPANPSVTSPQENHIEPIYLIITIKNWKKYQEDSSAERTRQWRQKRQSGDATSPSRGDAHVSSQNGRRDASSPSRGDAVEEIRRDTPPVMSPSPSTPDGWPVDRNGMRLAFHEVYPEAVHRDCPEPRFRTSGQCIDSRYLRAHPDVTGYPTRDAQGTPMQCPYHRQLASSLPW